MRMPKTPRVALTADTAHAAKILSEKLGGTPPKISKATRGMHVPKAAPLALPGSHAALLQRLFGGK